MTLPRPTLPPTASATTSAAPSAAQSSVATPPLQPETLAAQGLGWITTASRDLVPPIHPATTFERAGDGSYPGGRVYARDASPAYDQAEALLAALEAPGEAAAEARLFASGMAAASAALHTLRPGSRLVAPRNMYWALRRWLREFAAQWQIELAEYDNADLADLARALGARADLLWIETPANPTWEITDIAAAAALGHAAGATVLVDSTVPTPILSRPLALGADLVMHSATKYLNGHSDVVAGALVAGPACAASEGWARIKTARNLGGAILGPFEAWLLLRGMRTLALRVRQSSSNALRVAEALAAHPAVAHVAYPGLPTHPGHAVAARQMHGGFGGMLSFQVRGDAARALAVTARLQVFKRATSLGAVESLVEHRASVEGAETRCPQNMLRLSIGIEAADDLIADLHQALAA